MSLGVWDEPVPGGLSDNDPQRLIGSSINRRHGPVGVDVALLEKVCHGGMFEVSHAQVWPSIALSLPAAYQSRCRALSSSSTVSVYMPPCYWHDNNR